MLCSRVCSVLLCLRRVGRGNRDGTARSMQPLEHAAELAGAAAAMVDDAPLRHAHSCLAQALALEDDDGDRVDAHLHHLAEGSVHLPRVRVRVRVRRRRAPA